MRYPTEEQEAPTILKAKDDLSLHSSFFSKKSDKWRYSRYNLGRRLSNFASSCDVNTNRSRRDKEGAMFLEKWQPTPIFLLGKSQGQRGLACCSPWGHSWTGLSDYTELSLRIIYLIFLVLLFSSTCHISIWHSMMTNDFFSWMSVSKILTNKINKCLWVFCP